MPHAADVRGSKAQALFLSRRRLLLMAAIGGLMNSSAPGLTINLTYDSSIPSAQLSSVQTAMNEAVQEFTSVYTASNATVNIIVRASTGTSILGQSNTYLQGNYTYSQIKNALALHATSADQITSLSAMGADPTNGSTFWVPTAEAKTLGLHSANDTNTDGFFTYGTGYNYTFDPANRAVSGKIDFIGVATHELSEIMGRIPGLGSSGYYLPYDLYRFTGNGARSVSISDNNVYFSVDNGATNLKNYNFPNGNGSDPQDWASGSNDSFNAFSSYSVKNAVTTVDQQVMNVLGYNAIASNTFSGKSGGAADGNWTTDGRLNFSGAAYSDAKQAIFADTDANGNAVGTGAISIQSNGVAPAVATFANNSVTYTLTTTGTTGIGGSAAVVLAGSGVVKFNSLNTYSGGTVITSGELRANNGTNGSATGSGRVTVNGGTLGGNGTISGPVSLTLGTITAGSDASTTGKLITSAPHTWSGGTSYLWKINDAAGQAGATDGWDDLTMTTLTLTGLTSTLPFTITAKSLNGSSPGTAKGTAYPSQDSWIIAESGQSISIDGSPYANGTELFGPSVPAALKNLFNLNTAAFTVAGVPEPTRAFHLDLIANPSITGGQDLQLSYTAVPEPTTMLLALSALAPLPLVRRRRHTACDER